MKSFKLLLAVVFALTALTIPATTSTAAVPQPVLEDPGRNISGNNANKWPSVAVGNGRVYVASSAPNEANLVESPEASSAFGGGKIGTVGSNSTYFNAAVAVGTAGTVHYVWINNGGTILHASKSGTTWSPTRTVAGGQNFANTLNVAVRGDNEVFVAWRHQGSENGSIGFAFSNTSGASWQVIKDVPTPAGAYAGRPDLVAGAPNLPAYVTWTGVDGNVYFATWTGTDFSTECLTCVRLGGRKDFFGSSIGMSTDGRPYIAWRSVSLGVYYGSRQPDGTWGFSRAFPDYPDISSVSIAVDKRDNVHLSWLSKQGGATNGYYAVQKPGQFFSNPLRVFNDSGAFKANIDLAASLQPQSGYAHIAVESFRNGQFIHYSRVRVAGIGCDVSAAGSGDEVSGIRALYQNPIFFPMVTKPPVVTPPPPPPTC